MTGTAQMTDALAHALLYASKGWRVAPVAPGRKSPRLDAWQDEATTDEAKIRSWWARWSDDGVAIVTGRASGIFVVDVDYGEGKVGDDSIADLEATHGDLPATVQFVTGSGGAHHLFRMPDGVEIRNSASVLGRDIDIRGEGGCIVAPPTVHPNGRRYQIEVCSHPDETEVAEAPAWLIDALTRLPDAAGARRTPPRERSDGEVLPGDRLAEIVSWAQLLAADGATFVGARRDHVHGGAYELWSRPPMPGEAGFYPRTSATLYYAGSDVLKIFSPHWIGPDWTLDTGATYNLFGYYTATRFHGDHHAAASHIGAVLAGRDEADAIDELVGGWPDAEPPPGVSEPVSRLPAPQLPEAAPPAPVVDLLADALRSAVADAPKPIEEPWAPLVAFDEGAAAPYPIDVLPGWVAEHCTAVADRLQVPVDLCGQLAVGALAAVMMGHAEIAVQRSWTEPLNLYLATAMGSGSGKSPAAKMMTGPLREFEKERVEQKAEEIGRAQLFAQIAAAKARKLAKAAENADDRYSDTAAVDAMLEAAKAEEIIPPTPRLLANDATPEALSVLLWRHGGRIAVVSAEAELFDMVSGLYNQGRPVNLAVYLNAWSGDTITIDRKSTDQPEIRIDKPLLTVSVAVQPSVFANLASRPELTGKGFTQRFMYALPPDLRGRRDRMRLADDNPLPTENSYRSSFLDVARRVATWQLPAVLRLADGGARMLLGAFDSEEHRIDPDGGDLRDLSEWVAKRQGSVIRLAGILHLADGRAHNEPVSCDTIRRALSMGDFWTANARAVAAMWHGDAVAASARRVAAWLTARRPATVTVTDLHTNHRWIHNAEEARAVAAVLVERGYLRPVPETGRRVTRYEVNPAVGVQERA